MHNIQAPDFLGNFFKHMHEKYPGANKKEKYSALFQDVLAFHKKKEEFVYDTSPRSIRENKKLTENIG